MKKVLKWLASALYGLVMIEVVIMISPFAFYWYSLYAPTLQGLHRWRATAWMESFFLPHSVITTSSFLEIMRWQIGSWAFGLGLLAALICGVQVYATKLFKRKAAESWMYAHIRHPFYSEPGGGGIWTAHHLAADHHSRALSRHALPLLFSGALRGEAGGSRSSRVCRISETHRNVFTRESGRQAFSFAVGLDSESRIGFEHCERADYRAGSRRGGGPSAIHDRPHSHRAACPPITRWRSLSGRRHPIRFTRLSRPPSKTKEFAPRSIKNPARRSRPTSFQRTTAWSTCSPMSERTIACSAGCPFAAWHRGWGSQFRPSILITRTGSWELRRTITK